MGGEETERFGDKQRMTKTERGRANKRKPACVCVRVCVRVTASRRAQLCAPLLVDELVSNQIRYRLPPQLSVKTQSPRRHLSSDTPSHSAPSALLVPPGLPSPIKLTERHAQFHDMHFSLCGHILSGSKE